MRSHSSVRWTTWSLALVVLTLLAMPLTAVPAVMSSPDAGREHLRRTAVQPARPLVAKDKTTPDFVVSLTARPSKAREASLRFRITNPRPWVASSVRACFRLRSQGARILSLGQSGSAKNRSTACWIGRQLGSKRHLIRTFRVRTIRRSTRLNPLRVTTTVAGGNSNVAVRRWALLPRTVRTVKPQRRQARVASLGEVTPPVHASAARAAGCAIPAKLGVAFVVDDSGSMSSSDPGNLRSTAVAVGLDQLPDASLAGATRFADGSHELFPVASTDVNSRPGMKLAASNLNASGGTDFEAAFLGAQTQLQSLAASDKKAVIFLSDGEPNDVGFSSDRAIGAAGIPIYTIGLGSANPAIMADIAARSGGQTFDAASAGALQAIFARIVSLLTCDAQAVTDTFSLNPGASRTIPFSVAPDDGEFRALAAWSGGGVTVTATRPNGSSLTPTSLLAGEGFVDEASYALLTGTNPQSGGWQLTVLASASNPLAVDVTIDVFKRQLTAKLPLAPPPQPPPPPPQSPPPPPQPPVVPFNVATKGRHLDPCSAGLPGFSASTKKIFGGTETFYDRGSSAYLVCTGFGAPEDLEFSPAMQCAVIAAIATYGGPVVNKAAEVACTGGDIITALQTGSWTGAAKSKACGYFSDIFATGVGVLVAGAAAPTGPGAVAVGVGTYKAFAAGLKLACGGLLDGGALALGVKLEADHERNIAKDVVRYGRCIKVTHRLGTYWSATACR